MMVSTNSLTSSSTRYAVLHSIRYRERNTLVDRYFKRTSQNRRSAILCVTQDNIHNDWILFEAGPLYRRVKS